MCARLITWFEYLGLAKVESRVLAADWRSRSSGRVREGREPRGIGVCLGRRDLSLE